MFIFFLQFTAPIWKGTYVFAVCLRSDSYLGFHQQKDIKLDVKEAPKHISESEDSEEEGPVEDNAHESDYTTDEDLPDDDWKLTMPNQIQFELCCYSDEL